jgi:sugar lactone lactonase YvrE
MRTSSISRNALYATAALAVLSGCSSAGSPAFTGTPPSSFQGRNKASGAAEFISDWNNHAIYIIDRQGTVTSSLHVDGPEGVAVDARHNLYVVNAAGPNVLVYDPPYNGVAKTLSDAGNVPVGVAVDRNGNVAVTSVGSPSIGPGGIVFYSKGATSPTNTIAANGTFAGDFYCAFDANGNLYLDSENGSGPFEAGEVVGGITGTSVTPLTTANLVRFPGGMQVTKSGRIAILDQGSASGPATIYAYNPPSGGSLGNPVATTTLSASNNAVAFAFEGRNDGSVLTADTYLAAPKSKFVKPDQEDQIGQTQLFKYPAGGNATESVRLPYNAILAGVAANPPERP